jgi:4-hydroxy-3-methylbut-2-enyl diphosphate reductase
MEVHLASPRGFCAGVERAIAIVETALARFGAPIYVRHEVVHNRSVVERLGRLGAIFIEDLADVPPGATLVFSAHGVSRAVRKEAALRGFRVFDATCPLVTKVHLQVARLQLLGKTVIMIGHRGHPEVEGTMGQFEDLAQDVSGRGTAIYLVENHDDIARLPDLPGDQLAFVTQTTLSVDDAAQLVAALQARFPDIAGPRKDDICYATQNRQDAVKDLAQRCEVIFVVGSASSSNSNRLREVAASRGATAYLIDCCDDIVPSWLQGATRVGVTAGASAPETLVQGVVAWLQSRGYTRVEEAQRTENVVFALPKNLMV